MFLGVSCVDYITFCDAPVLHLRSLQSRRLPPPQPQIRRFVQRSEIVVVFFPPYYQNRMKSLHDTESGSTRSRCCTNPRVSPSHAMCRLAFVVLYGRVLARSRSSFFPFLLFSYSLWRMGCVRAFHSVA